MHARRSRPWFHTSALVVLLVAAPALATAARAQSCVKPPSGLVAWWPVDGSGADIAGGHDGTPVGVAFAAGEVAQAIDFAGPDNYIRVDDQAALDFTPAQDYTIDAWMRTGPLPDAGHLGLIEKAANFPSPYPFAMRLNTGQFGPKGTIFCAAYDGASFPTVSGTTRVDDGGWHLVACVFRHSQKRIEVWIDGALDGAVHYTALGNLQNGLPVYFGTRGPDPFGTFDPALQYDGLLDEMTIFGRALDGSDLLAIHDAGPAGQCKLPVADAGPDQTVDENADASLDGSRSFSPFDRPLSYAWSQLAGPVVALDAGETPGRPSFLAPPVAAGGATLTFELVVADATGSSAPDTVNVTVKNVNNQPIADAGPDQAVLEGSPVTLDGTASYDPDAEALTYSWMQVRGPVAILSDPTAARPSFTAPFVGPQGATVTFALVVSDGIDASAADSVDIAIENVDHAPIANAGPDQTRAEGTTVTLDGTGSRDPDSDPLVYFWAQVSGPPAPLSDPVSATPSFTAPDVGRDGDRMVFELVVGDGFLLSPPSRVTINVLDADQPPVCSLAVPKIGVLWPPDHKLVEVGITGVTDPDSPVVTITVTGVAQDEPVSTRGSGDTSPDTILRGDRALLRSERSGNGNGRVYRIAFTADDGRGGTCSGSVSVCVPRNKRDSGCVDDGPVYDSTSP